DNNELATLRNRFKRDAEFLLRGTPSDDHEDKGHKEEEAKPLPLINRHSVFWIMASMAVTYYMDFLNVVMHDEHIKSFNIALWPVWSFFTPLILFTQFMGVVMLISLLG
ncbi:hypothetical protein CRUP_017036, partial [Coryphaenoides rupestris]